MSIEAEAVYENGTLTFDHALPLEEHQRVKVSIDTEVVKTMARRRRPTTKDFFRFISVD